METNNTDPFWPDNTRLVISISMQMEAGAQPESGAESKPFAVVPYTLHMNDIVNYEGRYFSTDAYAADLKCEFDVLYEEGDHRRRMMSVSAHDRIAGRPARMRVLEDFIQYAQSHPRRHLHAQGGDRELRDRKSADRSREHLGATP